MRWCDADKKKKTKTILFISSSSTTYNNINLFILAFTLGWFCHRFRALTSYRPLFRPRSLAFPRAKPRFKSDWSRCEKKAWTIRSLDATRRSSVRRMNSWYLELEMKGFSFASFGLGGGGW